MNKLAFHGAVMIAGAIILGLAWGHTEAANLERRLDDIVHYLIFAWLLGVCLVFSGLTGIIQALEGEDDG